MRSPLWSYCIHQFPLHPKCWLVALVVPRHDAPLFPSALRLPKNPVSNVTFPPQGLVGAAWDGEIPWTAPPLSCLRCPRTSAVPSGPATMVHSVLSLHRRVPSGWPLATWRHHHPALETPPQPCPLAPSCLATGSSLPHPAPRQSSATAQLMGCLTLAAPRLCSRPSNETWAWTSVLGAHGSWRTSGTTASPTCSWGILPTTLWSSARISTAPGKATVSPDSSFLLMNEIKCLEKKLYGMRALVRLSESRSTWLMYRMG